MLKDKGSSQTKTRRDNDPKSSKKRKKEDVQNNPSSSNPFGDFDWKLKREKEMKEGKRPKKLTTEEQEHHKATVLKEIEKLKRQREERDRQKRLWEEERAKQSRLREQSCYGQLAKKEDEFHLSQAKLRAQMRLKENRAKPIDYFYVAINPDQLPIDKVILSPAKVLDPLGKTELEELLQDIPLFIELDSNVEYWKSLLILINHKLSQMKEPLEFADDGVHTAITSDIDAILVGKSEKELLQLEQQISAQLNGGEILEEEYWLSLLKRLCIKKAYAKVDEMYRTVTELHLTQLAARGAASPQQIEALRGHLCFELEGGGGNPVKTEYLERKNSAPPLLTNQSGAVHSVRKILTEDEMYELEESKGMEEDEEKFSQEFILPSHNIDSKRWVKPRYFNRVKTGYEWNKYNQVHYDLDSPPPKVVQGYKFNIFFPDLLDKSIPPTYKIHPTENPDLVILHFQAGPPYQDIAFKIVNGEWEYSQKTGFKCMFSNGILHLWFNFKKYRYRR